jgi:hypothetical protein
MSERSIIVKEKILEAVANDNLPRALSLLDQKGVHPLISSSLKALVSLAERGQEKEQINRDKFLDERQHVVDTILDLV